MPIQRRYDFKPGTKISSDQVDEEFDQLIAQINTIESANLEKDEELRKVAQLIKVTKDNGWPKIDLPNTTDDILASILTMGPGVHTFYAVANSKNLPPSNLSIRGIAHLTSHNFGWIWCTDYRNQIWTNYYDANRWLGWRLLVSNKEDQETLWTGIMYPTENETVRPTKKLSECRNGWILVWSDYDPGVGANNFNFTYTYIPKKIASLHNGANHYFDMLAGIGLQSIDMTGKVLYVHDDRLIGHENNKVSGNWSNDVCLRYVLEF